MNLIIANEITPHLTAEEYMDKGEYENELKQVLGDTRAAYDISEHDTLVFGSNGLLVAGPNSRHHEPLLCSYMQVHEREHVEPLRSGFLHGIVVCMVRTGCVVPSVTPQFMAMDLYVRNFFNRTFLLGDAIKEVE